MSLVFGVYPGGVAGNDAGGLASGAVDDPASVHRVLGDLQGADARPLLVRCYAAFRDDPGPGVTDIASPLQGESYAVNGRMLDLVLHVPVEIGEHRRVHAVRPQRYWAVRRHHSDRSNH